MSAVRFRIRLLGAKQEINRLSESKSFRNYCEIVCNLSCVLGDCRHKPPGYYRNFLNGLSEKHIGNLAENPFQAMLELKYLLKNITDTYQVKNIIENYCF